VIAAVLPREDPRDVLFAPAAKRIADLPRGARLGTVSLRRTAQVKALRPDIQVTPLRGNVETRLQKVKAGAFDAVLLARAGLKRLGLLEAGGVPIDPDEILPAVGQGAIAVICRESDADIRAWLALAEDETSARCVTAERAMLAVLDGSCRTPIGGLAEIAGETLALRGLVAKPDGSVVLRAHASGPAADAVAIGEEVGRELRRRAGPGFVAGWR
jgi:hydroxymethylbilane synthase